MDPFRDETDLSTELRALRPAPRPAFAAELDERAAAGFPRRSPVAVSPLGRLAARVRALPPRRLALSTGAIALATLTVATAVVAIDEPSSSAPVTAMPTERHAGHGGKMIPFSSSVPRARRGSSGVELESEASAAAKSPLAGQSSGNPGAGAAGESGPSYYNGAGPSGVLNHNSAFNLKSLHRKTGPYVFPARHRDVERSAQMVLGAAPAEIAEDAARVFETVHAYHGIVLSSSVNGGGAGDAGARFELLIPAAKLGDALAAFSGIAEVRSRHDATDDITAPTVSVGEHLQDSRATIAGLLVQLAGADSASERAEVEAELHAERHRAASLRSQVTKLNRRANLSRVLLRIVSGDTSASDGSGSSWGAGDALGDAGHILGIAAGVAIVGLAILLPLALIALLIWLAGRAWVRRGREHALD